MAKIAIIKLFNGLNMAPAQLAGELVKAGHEVRIIFFKKKYALPIEQKEGYLQLDYKGEGFMSNAKSLASDLYKPINDVELQHLYRDLEDFAPDAIAYTVFSGIIKVAAELAPLVKARFPVPVIWGGPGPTLEPEKCVDYSDLLCINEGEEVIVELAEKIDAGKPLDDIMGTWYRKPDGEVIKHESRPLIALDDLAQPYWALKDYVHIEDDEVLYDFYPDVETRSYPIMTQRGCPFSCSFCIESKYQDMFGKKNSLRRKNIDSIIEELKWAKENLPIKDVMFYDDVFTVHPRWLDEFLPRYKEEIGLPFWCYTYPTTHTRELLAKLKDAGCFAMTMGIQSGSERILKEYFNRPTAKERVIEASREIVDSGIAGFFDIITKIDFETEDDLRETFELLLQLPINMHTFVFSEMAKFPTYSYSENVIALEREGGNSRKPTDEDYEYYHRLYLLTRSTLPVEKIREIADDPKYRENPELIEQFYDHKPVISFTDRLPWREKQVYVK